MASDGFAGNWKGRGHAQCDTNAQDRGSARTMHMNKPLGKPLSAIGLMSGTSIDGVDAALIETNGEDHVFRRGSVSLAYDEAFRAQLRQALSDAAQITARDQRPGCLGAVEHELTLRHVAAVERLLAETGQAPGEIDLIALHGQTVLHRPHDRLTVQIGDGPQLAAATGIDVVYDLRAADVAAGGQGAPLAPAYHRAMAAQFGAEPLAVLNIGGVANVTFVASDGELAAFDTGPGNALLDDWMFARTGAAFDRDGLSAQAGAVDPTVLASLMSDPYFAEPPPKSLDRNHFPARHLAGLSTEDGAATLVAFTVEAIARAAAHAAEAPARWLVCGGGRHNQAIMGGLGARLAGDVVPAEAAGFDGDDVEAEAWAYLGVRGLHGLPITFPGTTGIATPHTGGVLAKASLS